MWRFRGLFLILLLMPAGLMARTVHFNSADGVYIEGDLRLASRGSNDQIALFVHDVGQDHSVWDELAAKLQERGMASLSIDVRGHGESTVHPDGLLDYELFSPDDWQDATNDVDAARRWITERAGFSRARTHLVGAGIGASLIVLSLARENGAASVSLLSPGTSYSGLNVGNMVPRMGQAPVRMFVSTDDDYSMRCTPRMAENLTAPHEIVEYESAGHGTDILLRAPAASQDLLAWLLKNRSEAAEQEEGPRPGTESKNVELGRDLAAESQADLSARKEAAAKGSSVEVVGEEPDEEKLREGSEQ